MEKSGLTALVFGATGLTGNLLTTQLLNDPAFSEVKIFSRKKTGLNHPKAKEVIIDFDNIDSLKENIHGDVLFCCLGTTIGKAGSREAFEKVDLHYPALLAQIASANKVKKFLMISSLGANKNSSNFYLRTKGKAEEAVTANNISSIYFFRPGMLLGKRGEFRLGESIGKVFMELFSFIFVGKLKKYRGVQAGKVAAAMKWFAVNGSDSLRVVENDEILSLPVDK